MTLVSDEMLRLMRVSLPAGDALVPIHGMSPHFMSRRGDLGTEELTHLLTIDLDGEELHVYLKT
jgi:hypothetical protein